MRARWDAYWTEAIEPRVFLLRHLKLTGADLVTLQAAVNIILGALPVFFVIATSILIGRTQAAIVAGLDSPQWRSLVSAFLIASALFVAQQLLTPVSLAVTKRIKQRVDSQFYGRLIDVSLRSTGIGSLEDQANLESLHTAVESLETGHRTPGDACAGTIAYLARYTRLIGFSILVGAVVSWWAGSAVLAATMTFRYGHRSGLRIYMRVWPRISMHRRERDYFLGVGVGSSTAKELRVFGLTAWMTERYRNSAMACLAPMWKTRRSISVDRFLWFAAAGIVVFSSVLVHMLRSAATDGMTLTQLTLGMQATVGAILLGEFYHEADEPTQFGMASARALDDFEKRIQASAVLDVHTDATGDALGMPQQSIRFADVSFAYAGSTRCVLDHLELTLHAGECTAIVGLNGAGKTTLVKLLARLYEPTGGALLIDGLDVRELAVDSWRRQIGVIFQDFNRYELSVADNIAFGAIERPRDPDGIRRAATAAAMSDFVDSLPLGFETLLARHYEAGVDLSGGQWQRIAIARALYAVAAGSRVLVLDEPTAALDVRAEAGFFEEFATVTSGLTTLLISHRFSSVRHADRIVVLEHGRVIETGTHESLIESGGRYANLFHIQAQSFALGLDDAGPATDDDELDDVPAPETA